MIDKKSEITVQLKKASSLSLSLSLSSDFHFPMQAGQGVSMFQGITFNPSTQALGNGLFCSPCSSCTPYGISEPIALFCTVVS